MLSQGGTPYALNMDCSTSAYPQQLEGYPSVKRLMIKFRNSGSKASYRNVALTSREAREQPSHLRLRQREREASQAHSPWPSAASHLGPMCGGVNAEADNTFSERSHFVVSRGQL
eukprot:365661-Chlamydomonas_euryale.AAC.58